MNSTFQEDSLKRAVNKLFLLRALMAVALCLAPGRATAQNFAAWPVTLVAAGANHTLFTKSDGTLYVMGDNSFGQLGLGTGITYAPVPQSLTNGVFAVSAGQAHSLFRIGNTLWAMGDNEDGELGDKTTISRYTPVAVFENLHARVTSFAAGGYHSIFVTFNILSANGDIWTMGDNADGELGDGGHTSSSTQEDILSTSLGMPAIATGSGFTDNFFIKPNGTWYGMGSDSRGQLDLGEFLGGIDTPINIAPTFTNIMAVAGGFQHTLILRSDGSLWATGDDTYGQLGYGTNTEQLGPVEAEPSGVTAIAAGYYHSLFIKSDGSLWAMGGNFYGELGDGTTTSQLAPELIVSNNVVAVAAGEFHSLFIKSDGSLWGMGYNNFGQLGTGDFVDRHIPVQIVAPPPLLNLALSSSNLVFNWPSNAVGFALYSTTDLTPPATWTSNSVTPVLVGNQFVVTNPVSGPRKYFRLGL